jgi:hypothetical protein
LVDPTEKRTHLLFLNLHLSKLEVLANELIVLDDWPELPVPIIHSVEFVVLDLPYKFVTGLDEVGVLDLFGFLWGSLLLWLFLVLRLLFSILPLLGEILASSCFLVPTFSLSFESFLLILITVYHSHLSCIILLFRTLLGRVSVSFILDDVI